MWMMALSEPVVAVVTYVCDVLGRRRHPSVVQCIHGEHVIMLKAGSRVCAKCGVRESTIASSMGS
jgi:hypothetical protein